MGYCKPVTVYFEIRGPTRVGVISERMQGPDRPLERRWTVDSLCGEQEQLEGSRKSKNIPFG